MAVLLFYLVGFGVPISGFGIEEVGKRAEKKPECGGDSNREGDPHDTCDNI